MKEKNNEANSYIQRFTRRTEIYIYNIKKVNKKTRDP